MAKAVGYYLLERRIFRDGIFFIDLRGVQSAEGVRAAIALELGIDIENDGQLFAYLGNRNCLLILDNCEDPLHHDLKVFRRFIGRFLERVKHLKLLLTSRQALGGGLPGAKENICSIRQLEEEDAAFLFALKAKAALGREMTGQ
ncbi:MAG: hypothetical protein GTO40_24175, partial [Deltaproteobacteria bacterium]|nr:hypothetical protein [Deltaproteobacteria bacterium]